MASGFSVKDWMTDDSYFCTRLDRLCALKRNIFYERSISKKQLLLEIIERIGCTKSIQPSKEVRIVGHSVLDWKTLGCTIHTFLNTQKRIRFLSVYNRTDRAKIDTKTLFFPFSNILLYCVLSYCWYENLLNTITHSSQVYRILFCWTTISYL